jgi:hypothetical protein
LISVGVDVHLDDSSLANDNDEVLRWMGSDGDSTSASPLSCRRTDDNGLFGANCVVTRGEFAHWSLIGLWGIISKSLSLLSPH